MDNVDPEVERKMKRVALLKMQCKKHQIFREKAQEAEKMAEAGMLHIQIGCAMKTRDSSDPEALVENVVSHLNYESAVVCMARAKRLCRDILRGKR